VHVVDDREFRANIHLAGGEGLYRGYIEGDKDISIKKYYVHLECYENITGHPMEKQFFRCVKFKKTKKHDEQFNNWLKSKKENQNENENDENEQKEEKPEEQESTENNKKRKKRSFDETPELDWKELAENNKLNTLRVEELKKFLGEHGLNKTGKKIELIQRVQSFFKPLEETV